MRRILLHSDKVRTFWSERRRRLSGRTWYSMCPRFTKHLPLPLSRCDLLRASFIILWASSAFISFVSRQGLHTFASRHSTIHIIAHNFLAPLRLPEWSRSSRSSHEGGRPTINVLIGKTRVMHFVESPSQFFAAVKHAPVCIEWFDLSWVFKLTKLFFYTHAWQSARTFETNRIDWGRINKSLLCH